MPKCKVLIIDNYDSFTFNLFQYLGELGGNPIVKRNDEISLQEIGELAPSHIVISPGPGRPDEPGYFGINLEVILSLSREIPILGVCLGMQGICYALGGRIVQAPRVMHGKVSQVTHNKKGIFHGVRSPLPVMRYHSLIVDKGSIPKCLEITATTTTPSHPLKGGVVMAMQHITRPLFGVQFHPESIGTPAGKKILQNFLKIKIQK